MGLTNKQTAERWASGAQESGRSSGGHVFFEGHRLYSYGYHYLTGYIVRDGEHSTRPWVLLNADKYSVTTGSHTRDAWEAVYHGIPAAKIVHVPGLTALGRLFYRRDTDGVCSPETKAAVREWAVAQYVNKDCASEAIGGLEAVFALFNMSRSVNAVRKEAEARKRYEARRQERDKRHALKRNLRLFRELTDADRKNILMECQSANRCRWKAKEALELMRFAKQTRQSESLVNRIRDYRREARARAEKLEREEWARYNARQAA